MGMHLCGPKRTSQCSQTNFARPFEARKGGGGLCQHYSMPASKTPRAFPNPGRVTYLRWVDAEPVFP